MKKIKIALFALTGFGNNALEAILSNENSDIAFLSTRKEKGIFPYYPCENIADICIKKNVPVFYDLTECSFVVDICIVATYHLKIQINKSNFKKGFNIHPSLLPDYKGKDPINAAINAKEKFTGTSIQKLTNKFDEGKVYKQKKIKIEPNDNKSSIMKKMCNLYYEYTNYIIENYKYL